MSQAEMGDVAGVQKQAQLKYEKGDRHPDAQYLAAISVAGADVLYILTGQRLGGAALAALPLAPDEAALLDNYRHSSPEGQKAIKAASAALAQPAGEMKRTG